MFNLDDIKNQNNKEHNKKWPFIPDNLYRISLIGGSGSGKTNALLNLMSQQGHIDKIYLYPKDLSELKYAFLIKRHENAGIKHLSNPKHLLSTQTIWMFKRILMTTTQTEREKS